MKMTVLIAVLLAITIHGANGRHILCPVCDCPSITRFFTKLGWVSKAKMDKILIRVKYKILKILRYRNFLGKVKKKKPLTYTLTTPFISGSGCGMLHHRQIRLGE